MKQKKTPHQTSFHKFYSSSSKCVSTSPFLAAFSACLSACLKMTIFVFVANKPVKLATLCAFFPSFMLLISQRTALSLLRLFSPVFCSGYIVFSSLWSLISASAERFPTKGGSACSRPCWGMASLPAASWDSALMAWRTHKPTGTKLSPSSSLLPCAIFLPLHKLLAAVIIASNINNICWELTVCQGLF